jgi:hypothetical protein
MAQQIQIRRDIAANWTSANPILAQGEMGLETNTNKVKIGDGTTAWNSLSYFGGAGALASLSDVSFTSLASGQFPMANASGIFTNQSLGSLIYAITSLGSLAVMNQLSFTSLLNQPSLGSLAFRSTLSSSDVGLGNVTNDAQLKIASNLSDLNNVTTARTNLSLGSLAVLNSLSVVLPSTASVDILYSNGIVNFSTISTNIFNGNSGLFASQVSIQRLEASAIYTAFADLNQVQTGTLTSNTGSFNSTVSTNQLKANIVTASLASIGTLSFASLIGTIYHNSLTSIQGGTAGQYNHLTNAQLTVVQNTSGTNTGDQVLPIYGDGRDGDVTFGSGILYPDFATYNSGTDTYTLTRDVFGQTITVSSVVITAGYRMFATVAIQVNANIHNDGGNASGTTAGAGGLGGFFKAGGTGATGLLAASAGANGTAQATPTANTWVGGVGGKGAMGRATNTTFTGGMITTANSTVPADADGGARVTSNFINYLTRYVVGATNWQMTPSIGGGSGAKSIIGTTASSGGGGGGGGICFVAAPEITGGQTISANGGSGGNAAGTGGNFGGGGGGGGGVCCVIARTVSGVFVTADGGTGGTSVIGTNGTLPVATANGTSTSTSSTTLTITPTTLLSKGRLYILTIHFSDAVNTTYSVNSITGYGMQWNQISGSEVYFSTLATPTRGSISFYGILNTEPDLIDNQTITIEFPVAFASTRVIVDEISNVDLSTPLTGNVANNASNSATTLTVNLPSVPTTGNLVYSVFSRVAGTAPVAGAGNTLVNNQTVGPIMVSEVSSAQQSNAMSHTTATALAGVSFEIAQSIAGENGDTGWAGKVIRIYG